MLTLEEVIKEAKKHGVELNKEDSYFKLCELTVFNKKAFDRWKVRQIAAYKQTDTSNMAYYKRNGMNKTLENYKPRTTNPDYVSDKALLEAYNRHIKHNPKQIQLGEATSIYSCAINEFGGFSIGGKNNLYKHWDLLLQWYVHTTKYHYLKCATPTTANYRYIRAALKAVGFEMRTKEKSNHGKYYVEVWEFIKPMKKKEKK